MNSQLLLHETGRVAIDSFAPCERETRVRFAQPQSAESAEVFLVARRGDGSTPPLVVSVGEQEYSLPAPEGATGWLRAALERSTLRRGEIEIIVPEQPGWSLAFDVENRAPVVRLRVCGECLRDAVIHPAYGDAAIEANRDAWLALLPPSLQVLCDRWEWCWQLAEFLSGAWPYSNANDGASYAPWDARKILTWGKAQRDDNGEKPIAMCVHYAVAFVQFCAAMQIPARAVVLTPRLNSPYGHFLAEVWLEEFGNWAMLDPNLHLCFRDASALRPLAVGELWRRRDELPQLAQHGAGWKNHRARFTDWLAEYYLSGEGYRLWGVWARHDWIEYSEDAPPAHGAVPYAETDIIWCGDDENARRDLAMFPHFLSSQELSRLPLKRQIERV